MTNEKQLVRKLSEVMNEVKYIQKKGYNSFHKYRYATESDVAEKIREELAKRNIIMIPSVLSQEAREHTNQRGNREYIVTVMMQFTFYDGDTGEDITFQMGGQGQDAGDKGIYKAMTGAQKYALMKAFMIPTGDDPEADEGVDERNQSESQKQQSSNKPTTAQTKTIFAKITTLGKVTGKTVEGIKSSLCKNIGVASIDDMNKSQASKAIELLSEWEKLAADKTA
ncbi:ERF family protein [Ectobacillus antri]|uniref:ERF family protein n=1 Tax=Ectobacillus antri TaxID=2486280 RepID=UPI000F59098C|nr:ERF family protein [Ectobacillus antri]